MPASAVTLAICAYTPASASDAPGGRKRHPYTEEAYARHLLEVANLITWCGGDPDQVAAAWLHSTVRDTSVSLNQIKENFGAGVAGLIEEVMEVYTETAYPDFSRARRKELEAGRLGGISARAQTIKYADFISEGRRLKADGSRAGEGCLQEMSAALSQMKTGEQRLRAMAEAVLN